MRFRHGRNDPVERLYKNRKTTFGRFSKIGIISSIIIKDLIRENSIIRKIFGLVKTKLINNNSNPKIIEHKSTKELN